MITRYAIPFVILAVLFLPLPFAIGFLIFGVLLAVRPRGEPDLAAAVVSPTSPGRSSSEVPLVDLLRFSASRREIRSVNRGGLR